MAAFEQTEKFLKQYLDELDEGQLKSFQWHLHHFGSNESQSITKADLEKASREKTVDKLVQVYGEEEAVVTTAAIFLKMKLNNLEKKLTQAHICRNTEVEQVSSTTRETQQLHESVSSTTKETERDGKWTVTGDLSCLICFSIFTKPVTLQCGHNLCRSCVRKYWETKSSRTCPYCQQVTDAELQTNYNLMSLCENYSKRGWVEPSGGYRNDSYTNESHKTPYRNIKEKKEAFEKVKHVHDSSIKYIKSQNHDIEKKFKDDFKKLHTIFKKEEETRLAALRKEGTQKICMIERITELSTSTLSLFDTVKEIEDLGADKSLIQPYKKQLERAQSALPDPQQLSQALINESSHVENLQVRVLESVLSNIKDAPGCVSHVSPEPPESDDAECKINHHEDDKSDKDAGTSGFPCCTIL